MKKTFATVLALAALSGPAAFAHYGMIIPSDNMVSQQDGRSVGLTLSFSHPFETEGMILDTPVSFNVTHEGQTSDLLGDLNSATVMDKPGFTLDYPLTRPGTYVFSMEPQPYWEPAEERCRLI